MPTALKFVCEAQDGAARTGKIYTRRGVIETPVFMPIGTLGTVKGVRFEALENELDARIILGNTYHLWMRPGVEVINACGGLHKFTSWDRAILTDSGGFQVWSLSDLRRISEEGVEFRSQLDGSKLFLSPEISMDVQARLGSDIVMMFDECAPGQSEHVEAKSSMERTLRWAARSKDRFQILQNESKDAGRREASDETTGAQSLFGIVQGATHYDLRVESLQKTVEVEFDGYALGGLSVGEAKEVMYDIIERVAAQMPEDRPRYLMGVGTPEDLLESVERGVDMFDCVLPTRNARTGQAWTSAGKLNIKNARFAKDARPLDERCACAVCRRHTRAYIRHLYQCGEMLAGVLLTHHNLAFFLDTMRGVRQAIRFRQFGQFKREFLERFRAGAAVE